MNLHDKITELNRNCVDVKFERFALTTFPYTEANTMISLSYNGIEKSSDLTPQSMQVEELAVSEIDKLYREIKKSIAFLGEMDDKGEYDFTFLPSENQKMIINLLKATKPMTTEPEKPLSEVEKAQPVDDETLLQDKLAFWTKKQLEASIAHSLAISKVKYYKSAIKAYEKAFKKLQEIEK